MPANYDWNRAPTLRRERIADAETYAQMLNQGQNFRAWLKVGEGLLEWQLAAQELAGGVDLDTPTYRAAWKAGAASYPHLARIAKEKSDRHYAIWMWEHRDEVVPWHDQLNDKERRNWNHPRTIFNHCPAGKAARADRLGETPKTPKPKSADLDMQVGRLSNAIDGLELRNAGSSWYDLSPAAIDESAKNFIEMHGAEDTARFVIALQAQLGKPPSRVSPQTEILDSPRHPGGAPRWRSQGSPQAPGGAPVAGDPISPQAPAISGSPQTPGILSSPQAPGGAPVGFASPQAPGGAPVADDSPQTPDGAPVEVQTALSPQAPGGAPVNLKKPAKKPPKRRQTLGEFRARKAAGGGTPIVPSDAEKLPGDPA